MDASGNGRATASSPRTNGNSPSSTNYAIASSRPRPAAAPAPPPPAAEQAAPGPAAPWRQPLELGQELDAARFPLGVIPEALHPFLHDAAEATNCPIDIVALPLLALAGGAIGARRGLEIKEGWTVWPCIWAVTVCEPGNAKSTALDLCAEPFKEEQVNLLTTFLTEKKDWELKARSMKEEALPPTPTLASKYCEDVTREQVAQMLYDNPMGLPLIRDEILGWLSSMDEYKQGGRGGDRQFYLEIFNSPPSKKVDRRNRPEPLILTRPVLPITGGLQPDKLPRLRGQSGIVDGWLDRFLFAFPEPRPPIGENWLGVGHKAKKPWHDAVQCFWSLPTGYRGDRPEGKVVTFTETGRQAWERFTHFLVRQYKREDLGPVIRNTLAKLKTYGGRLALIVHFLRWAAGEVKCECVDGESMKRATKLVAYFLSHIIKVHGALESDPRVGDARRVLRCLERRREELKEFSQAELHQYTRRYFRSAALLRAPLRLLEEYGYLTSHYPELGSRPGPRSERYKINPLWPAGRRDPETLLPPCFELTAPGLAQCWVYWCQRLRGGQPADNVSDVTPIFAELLRQGIPAAELLAAIQDDGRDRSEHLWQFQKRIGAERSQPTKYTRKQKQAAAAVNKRSEEADRRHSQENEQRAARWAAVPESEKAELRRQARARAKTLRDTADDSVLLIDACLRLAQGATERPETPVGG